MPIRHYVDVDRSISVSQSFDAPTVYLDHWAVRALSDDLVSQARFVAALSAARGTLVICHLTFAEFAAVESAATCELTDAFLSRVFPNVFVAEFNVAKALEQERVDAELVAALRLRPPEDMQLLGAFAQRYPVVNAAAMKGMVAEVHSERLYLKDRLDRSNSGIAAGLSAKRMDEDLVKAAKHAPVDNGRRPMQLVFGEMFRPFLLDQNASMSKNDAMDIQHTIISTVCCDFTLLDGRFAAAVRNMRKRLEAKGITPQLAECYSARDDAIAKLLVSLEGWNGSRE